MRDLDPTRGTLCTAADRGHAEVMRQLLDGGADVNKTTTDDSCMPLFTAAQVGHAEVMRQLLDGGADVNKATTNDSCTPLFTAAQVGHAEVARQLRAAAVRPHPSCSFSMRT